ncbi:hypothetical protein SNOG_15101 [Parastagonospora nodorum SN15]|uniref:Uncharacterized protein n=1 Tax=Phaeosphaeria nodorum (strain SN15 / ATCC MYA-4574 / FGSC 10173) TaxID=321614 RepID=Q0TZU7_PHANO|nr:hypothetical protein SNOG_15101 [Parastagonospora nodorum SN15]EAT77644.1 hypothetical protein SNOG_15101 [Parastagonospora nodorum SN15]
MNTFCRKQAESYHSVKVREWSLKPSNAEFFLWKELTLSKEQIVVLDRVRPFTAVLDISLAAKKSGHCKVTVAGLSVPLVL